ncbi:MAG TPA: hypothetical protein VM075_02865 [Anaerolineae bacterium]|nr:hypothetical protein [Anaerolineae bacterium]
MRTRGQLGLVGLAVGVTLMLLAGCAPCNILPIPGGGPEIQFWAEEDVVPPGGCTMLHWQVSSGEQYPVFLNGREVAPEGEEEVCLEGPTSYELVVGVPGGSVSQTVSVQVEEPGPEGPPPEGGPEVINLIVDPDVIPHGGCAMLHWEVLPPEFPVFINGQEVEPVGEREECPEGTVTYELLVEAPGGPQVRTATLHVEVGPGTEPPPPASATATQPPPVATASAAPPQAPTATPPPPAQPTATTQSPPSGADVWPSDLYPDSQPQGNIWVRIVNNGPETLTNKKVRISGSQTRSTKTTPPTASGQNILGQDYTINLAPGQQQNINLGWQVDLSQYNYEFQVDVQAVDFTDPSTGNNSYTESFQLAAPQTSGTDLAMTDLYADKLLNGTVYGRITNREGAALTNVTVSFSCQWAKTAYGATFGLNESMGPRNMTITGPLPPGQDTPFNTYITVDLTQYWYNMTCTVNVPFSDPNTANNTYNETLAKP